MNIADITKIAGSDKRRSRVGRGRGSGKGKTCGRGHNGAGQRSGPRRSIMQEGGQMPTFRRLPKRGFSNAQFATRYNIVNLASIEERFESGTHITKQLLLETGLVRDKKLAVKILGNGALSKKVSVDAEKFSQSARAKIEAVGGTANVCSSRKSSQQS